MDFIKLPTLKKVLEYRKAHLGNDAYDEYARLEIDDFLEVVDQFEKNDCFFCTKCNTLIGGSPHTAKSDPCYMDDKNAKLCGHCFLDLPTIKKESLRSDIIFETQQLQEALEKQYNLNQEFILQKYFIKD